MREHHEVVFEHVQSIVVLAACGTLVWTDSFEVAGGLFAVLQTGALLAEAGYRSHVARVRRRSMPPGVPA